MKPRIFYIRPEGSKFKVECRIYETHRLMLAAIKKHHAGIANSTKAFTEHMKLPQGTAAIVFFMRKHLQPSVIAHELSHAAFCILGRNKVRNIPILDDDPTNLEERFCYLVQSLTEKFHDKVL